MGIQQLRLEGHQIKDNSNVITDKAAPAGHRAAGVLQRTDLHFFFFLHDIYNKTRTGSCFASSLEQIPPQPCRVHTMDPAVHRLQPQPSFLRTLTAQRATAFHMSP